jgi:DNA-binding MarR family transcriptional regulator
MATGAEAGAEAAVELTAADYQALAEFRYQIRRFQHFSEQAARAAGLEPQQHQLLLAVKGRPAGEDASVGVLAECLQLQPHSALELVDRLVERGLVERHRDDADRRRVLVCLTPRGEAALQQLSLHHWHALRRAGPALVQALEALMHRAARPPAGGGAPMGAGLVSDATNGSAFEVGEAARTGREAGDGWKTQHT